MAEGVCVCCITEEFDTTFSDFVVCDDFIEPGDQTFSYLP